MFNFNLYYDQNYVIKYLIVLYHIILCTIYPYCSVYVSVISLDHRIVHQII